MNYGFDSTTPLWKEDQKQLLADRLSEMVLSLPLAGYPLLPCVEVDGLYDGVKIRRITHLSDEARKLLVKTADAIYQSVMA